MTAVALDNFAPSDIQARRIGLGGSDAATALGINKYTTPLALWMEKTGRFVPPPAGEAAHWGLKLEDAIADEFTARTGKRTRRDNFVRVHPDHPFMFAHVDRKIVGENRGLEIKTTNAFANGWDKEGTDEIPEPYLVQCHHYIAVMGWEGMELAVLVGGQNLRFFTVERDDEFIKALIQREKEFWGYIESDTPPPMIHESDLDFLEVAEGDVLATQSIEDALSNLVMLKDKVKSLNLEITAEERKIKFFMGEKTRLKNENNDVLVTFPEVVTNRFDRKSFAKDWPLLDEKYIKKTTHRRFAIKKGV